MGNKMIILKEIRIGRFCFYNENGQLSYQQDNKGVDISSEETTAITHWMSDLASYFLFVGENPIEIPNTKVLNCSFIDIDSNNLNDIDPEITRIKLGGKQSYNHFGSNVIFMSRSEFNKLQSDEEKSEYLMNCLNNSLKNYFHTFGIPFQGLEEKIKRVKAYEWYIPMTKKILNKDKRCSIILEKKYGRYQDNYRLKYEILETNELKFIEIGSKLNLANIFKSKPYYYYFKENPETVPAFIYENYKWVRGNLFSFNWGNEEKYVFDPKALEVSKVLLR